MKPIAGLNLVAVFGGDPGIAPTFRGTGLVVAPGCVLTCRHVLFTRDGTGRYTTERVRVLSVRVDAMPPDIPVTSAVYDVTEDLALLEVASPISGSHPPLLSGVTVEHLPPLLKATWCVTGFRNRDGIPEKGTFVSSATQSMFFPNEGDGRLRLYQLAGGVHDGMSGSPVFVEAKSGPLWMGVAARGGPDRPISAAIATDHVARFLRSHGIEARSVSADVLSPMQRLVGRRELVDELVTEPVEGSQPMPREFDIFLSFKNLGTDGEVTRDRRLAADLFTYLTSQGFRVFFSAVSLQQLGVSQYKKVLDSVLDSALILVAVGTSSENLQSEWVRYEWDSFGNDILNGNKPEGRIFSYIEGMKPADLPRMLRQHQAIVHCPDSYSALAAFMRNHLKRQNQQTMENTSAGTDRSSTVTMPRIQIPLTAEALEAESGSSIPHGWENAQYMSPHLLMYSPAMLELFADATIDYMGRKSVECVGGRSDDAILFNLLSRRYLKEQVRRVMDSEGLTEKVAALKVMFRRYPKELECSDADLDAATELAREIKGDEVVTSQEVVEALAELRGVLLPANSLEPIDLASQVAQMVQKTLAARKHSEWLNYIKGVLVGVSVYGLFELLRFALQSLTGRAPYTEAQIYEIESDVFSERERWAQILPIVGEEDSDESNLVLDYILHVIAKLSVLGHAVKLNPIIILPEDFPAEEDNDA